MREKITLHKKQGVIADEGQLLGNVAYAYARVVSIYLANAVGLFGARRVFALGKPMVLLGSIRECSLVNGSYNLVRAFSK